MAVKEVRIIVDGVPQAVIFDNGLQAFVATVPQTTEDIYDVIIEAEDFTGGITTSVSIVSVPEGELLRFTVVDKKGSPVKDVLITAYHRNPTGGTNFGRADHRLTGDDGIADLYVNPANYNIEIEKSGFKKQILLDLPVLGGISEDFDNAGGTVPDTRTVKDPAGTPIQDASVKVVDTLAPPQDRLVAHKKTDVNGQWIMSLKAATQYEVTVEKAGLSLVRAVVENV